MQSYIGKIGQINCLWRMKLLHAHYSPRIWTCLLLLLLLLLFSRAGREQSLETIPPLSLQHHATEQFRRFVSSSHTVYENLSNYRTVICWLYYVILLYFFLCTDNYPWLLILMLFATSPRNSGRNVSPMLDNRFDEKNIRAIVEDSIIIKDASKACARSDFNPLDIPTTFYRMPAW